MGRYADGLMKILNAYQGPPLITALEILIATAEENAKTSVANEVAQGVCEGLHEGMAKGLKCRSCYEAEQLFPYQNAVEADIELARKGKDDEPDEG